MTRRLIYRPGSPLRTPRLLFNDLVQDFAAARSLAWRLLIRNLSARYRQTLLGYFWALFPPLATTAIWLILSRKGVVEIDHGSVSYPVFLITGTLLWQSFADAIQLPVRIVTESKSMLAKINFPREALPLTAFAECVFNSAIRMLVLAVALFWLDFVPAETIFLAMIGLLVMILLGTVIGVLLCPFALLYDDVSNSLVLLLQLWMYITPVVYMPVHAGLLGAVSILNPVSPWLAQTREWILTGQTIYLPDALVVFYALAGFSLFAFLLYRVALPRAIERLSS